MKIKLTHPDAKLPERATEGSAGYDIFMPSDGSYEPDLPQEKTALGFALEIPYGYIGMIVPRSGVGFNHCLEINNTVGIIDSDYRNEWFARIRTKTGNRFAWKKGDRLLQMLIVPIATPRLELVDELGVTDRHGGIGSTGR